MLKAGELGELRAAPRPPGPAATCIGEACGWDACIHSLSGSNVGLCQGDSIAVAGA